MANPAERNTRPSGILRSLIRRLRWLGSLQLAVVVLAVLSVVLILATLAEKRHGRPYALEYYYQNPWFIALMGLLSLNVLVSMLARFPWGWRRVGFVLTHVGLLTLLGGAALTYWRGIEGVMRIEEGEIKSSFVMPSPIRLETRWLRNSESSDPHEWPLDFALSLIRFERTENPGGMGDAGYASTVGVLCDGRRVQESVISLNRPLRFEGYVFYQSDYDHKGRRPATVLTVSKDPGRGLKYAGSLVLCLGMSIIMIQQGRKLSRRAEQSSDEH